jgi:hypothetical protein
MVLRAGRSAGRDRRASEHITLDLPDLRPDSQRVSLAATPTDPGARPVVPARRILVVTTATAPKAEVESVVRAHAGGDAEVQVVAPASKISWLDRLTNAEDDARADATERAEAASEELPGEHVKAHGGDVDPLQAIEDALRMFPADEIVVLTAPDEEATWLEAGLGESAQERFSVPVTHLVTR